MSVSMSLVGVITVFGLAFLLSDNRSTINFRTVAIAFAIQVCVAAFALYTDAGEWFFDALSTGVQFVINQSDAGIKFVFGYNTESILGPTIAFKILPVIIFFSAFMAVLYHMGVMQWVISIFGGWLHKLLGTSKAESMSAVANVFVGHTEAPLVVRPYLERMTQSELFAVMTGGCATIAGAVMAAYAGMGIELKYLLTASFMAAPGGLMMAKIVKPETESQFFTDRDVEYTESGHAANVFEAVAIGARDGLKLALNVAAMLLAFVALIALLNGLLTLTAGLIGYEDVTIEGLLGSLLAPLAFLLGVPWEDANIAGSLIGQKFVINEFIAYEAFAAIKDGLTEHSLTEHSQVVITFALCGFANLSSIGILLGGLGTIAPSRRSDIARLGLKAVLAGSLANFMSAVLAGFFLSLN